MSGIVQSLLPAVNAILGVRDSIGAIIESVYLVTRTWSGAEPGAGTPIDTQVQLLPTPMLKDYSQSLSLKEGGMIKQGDILLKGISKASYQLTDLDGSTSGLNIEKFFLVGAKLYQVINVTESYVTWNVQLRELTNQKRYLS